MLAEKSLVDVINERISSNELQLPVFHQTALKLQELLQRDDASIGQIARLITVDQALTSQVLRVANSAFFAGLSKVATIRDAVIRLGTKQVTNVVTLVTQSTQYRAKSKTIHSFMRQLWQHAQGSALGAKWLAERLGYKELAQEALLAGLLHDIGELFLLKVLDDVLMGEAPDLRLSKSVVLEVLDRLHVEQGALLMQQWNLPESYCDVAQLHHAEAYDTSNVLLTIVRLADIACKKLGVGLEQDDTIVLAVTQEAQSLGAKEVLLAELEIMLEEASALEV